ncbi:MAG TPA: alpha/beta hydrolase-fold protein [Actinomycetota bacterium]|nr:alpha/beta hydrolase-fold protein [Actinomycetota bacterium]
MKGELVEEKFDYDGGRLVTVYVPPSPPEAVVYCADGGWHISRLTETMEGAKGPSTMIVGIHGMPDDDGRFKEYLIGADPERFAAHEKFFVEEVRDWAQARFDLELPSERIAVWGASVGGEFSLAIGHRHPDVYGAIFCASPGGGYQPTEDMAVPQTRTYLVGGTEEQWFLENAARWAVALRDAGVDVVMTERPGDHGDAFWAEEFPLMVAWAFGT